MTTRFTFLFTIIITLSSSTYASFAGLTDLNPQIPSTSNPQNSSGSSTSDFFTSPPTRLDPFQSTDGGEIRPNYNGADWSIRDPMFNVINPRSSVSSTDDGWFPSITNTSNTSGSTNPINNSSGYNTQNRNSANISTSDNYKEFIHKISVIDANNFYTSPSPYRRDLKLLNLAYNLISSTTRQLNILHLGSGNGFVPLALAILGRYNWKVVSLDDAGSNTPANENILKDGKGSFLRRNLSFSTVENILNSPINRPSNGKSFDLLVFSKAVPRNFTFPSTVLSVMNPRGYLIYPQDDGKSLKMDRLDGSGQLTNIVNKTI